MIESVGITVRNHLEKHRKVFERLIHYLHKKRKTVYVEDRVSNFLSIKGLKRLQLGWTKVDLMLILGGDGTILRVLSKMKTFETKLFGINMGHLGFLSEIPPTQIHKTLDKIFSDKCSSDPRMMLEVELCRNKKVLHRFFALNEVVVSQGVLCRLISLKAKVDGRKVANYKADGLIVSTPTGSTAYNLSAGGPIVHPSLNAMILTPISPHSFSQKPIVIPDTKKIEITVGSDNASMNLTVDGQQNVSVQVGDVVRVRRGPTVEFLRLPTESYFMNLRNKLGWGERVEKSY